MSWASHNPELYEEICVRGVVNRILKSRFRTIMEESEVRDYVENLAEGTTPIDCIMWEVLMDWAATEIVDAECNYFASRADRARDAAKDQGL